jgi:2-polyprenyl-3-methyl-5-hydroxy-6-metoxy-1,4-benzoquinol methylase
VPQTALPLGPKPVDYFENDRADLVAQLPHPLGRTLDVGCGAGLVGAQLRAAGATRLVGVELDPVAAKRAEGVFDRVVNLDAVQAVAELRGEEAFDTVICYDVLEHLYDPAAVLRGVRELSARGGRLHISVPNARHASLVRDLVFRGTFGYTSWGHRDSTHLRWFTRTDIVRLLHESGWQVRSVATHRHSPTRTLLVRLFGRRVEEFLAIQWYLLCEL